MECIGHVIPPEGLRPNEKLITAVKDYECSNAVSLYIPCLALSVFNYMEW